jgi:hypothetical protein
MNTYLVIMESYDSEGCKRVKVQADSPYDAMAAAQERYVGWMPVDVKQQ